MLNLKFRNKKTKIREGDIFKVNSQKQLRIEREGQLLVFKKPNSRKNKSSSIHSQYIELDFSFLSEAMSMVSTFLDIFGFNYKIIKNTIDEFEVKILLS